MNADYRETDIYGPGLDIEKYRSDVDKTLRKTFKHDLVGRFEKAVVQYQLVEEGDRIAVCISGGKDSMLMAKLMQTLQRHSEVPFEAEYLIMDPGYNEINRRKVESNAKLLEIPYTLFESDIFEIANSQEKNPCFLCAKMRRGCLYGKARELGCNKIALGHHFNDVIETTVMGMLWGGQLQGMMPKLHSKNFPGMELIRPLYRVHEEDIIAWKNAHELSFIQCACRFTENCTLCDNGGGGSKRQEVKQLLKCMNRDGGKVEKNVFNAIHMLQFDTFPGWKSNGVEHSFLETYDDVQTTVTGVEEE